MKIYNITNLNKLFKVINSCDGDVLIRTDENVFNLKSILTQHFIRSFAGEIIPKIELEIQNSKDAKKIMDFMINNRFREKNK